MTTTELANESDVAAAKDAAVNNAEGLKADLSSLTKFGSTERDVEILKEIDEAISQLRNRVRTEIHQS